MLIHTLVKQLLDEFRVHSAVGARGRTMNNIQPPDLKRLPAQERASLEKKGRGCGVISAHLTSAPITVPGTQQELTEHLCNESKVNWDLC